MGIEKGFIESQRVSSAVWMGLLDLLSGKLIDAAGAFRDFRATDEIKRINLVLASFNCFE